MLSIWKKELKTLYYTSTGYVFSGIFLLLSTVFFFSGNMAEHSSDCLILLRSMSYLWMLLCPLLTMRLISGEKQQKTDKLLLSSPLSLSDILLGKYLAACTVLTVTTVCTLIFPIIVSIYGRIYPAEILTGYLGFVLMGCMFISVDLMISCLCSTPLIACIAGLGINLILWLFDVIAVASSGSFISRALTFLSPNQRFTPFICGQLSLANIIYDFCFIASMLIISKGILSKDIAS